MKLDNSSNKTSAEDGSSLHSRGASPASSLRALFLSWWRSVCHWHSTHTFVSTWLPAPFQPWFMGYVFAIPLQSIAVFFVALLVRAYPNFSFVEAPSVLIVLLISLGWGATPGVIATLIGALYLTYFALPPYFTLAINEPADVVGIFFYLLIGFIVSLVSSHTQHRYIDILQKEQELRAEAQTAVRQLTTVLDVLPVGVVIADRRGRFLQRNSATLQAWGQAFPHAESFAEYGQYKGWWTSTGQPVAAEDWAMVRAVTRGEVSQGEEIDIQTFDGQYKTLLHAAAPIRDENGAITGGVVATVDITERKRLERALRQAEQQAEQRAHELEAIFEAISDGLIILGIHDTPPRINQAARKLFALPDGVQLDLQFDALFELLDEQGQILPRTQWPENQLRRGEQIHEMDVSLRAKMWESTQYLSISGTPIYGQNGQMIGGVLLCRDVTEQRQLQRRTQAALETLLKMAEVMVHIPVEENASEEAIMATRQVTAQRLVELTCELLGSHTASMIEIGNESQPPQLTAAVGFSTEIEQQLRENIPGIRLQDYFRASELANLTRGEPAFFNLTTPAAGLLTYSAHQVLCAPMRLGEQLIGFLSIDYSTTEHHYPIQEEMTLMQASAKLAAVVIERERLIRKRTESQAAELAARSANRLKDEFLGIAGHELRSPLTTIRASVQFAKRHLARVFKQHTDLPPDINKSLHTIEDLLNRAERQVDMQNRLVSDLLDVSRIETERMELHTALHDLVALVQEVVEDQRCQEPERTINVSVDIAGEALVMVDADRVRQIITNYLSNALKYSEAYKPVNVRVEHRESYVRVSVQDEGPGLTSEQQQHIWERFYRVPEIKVKSGSGVGLGLGLHISRMMVELQGGKIGIDSQPGKGATFWFSFPLAETAEHPL